MQKHPKDGKLIYHLTSIENLESIIKHGLRPRSSIAQFDDTADREIIDFRKENGILHYIPFHFLAPSPFSGKVQEANPKKIFFYICIQREYAQKNDFKIIPKHPMALQNFKIYNYSEGFALIDWDKMNERNYHDYDCKQICMAECISDQIVQFIDINIIFAKDIASSNKIKKTYQDSIGTTCPVTILINEVLFKKHD